MSVSDEVLRIDDEAVVWSVAREERSERLAEEPLVIVMHGRGSHENDLAELFPRLPAGMVYASLRAPLSGAPWGLGGWTWFPSPASSSSGAGPLADDVEAAVAAVLAWVDRVEAAYGAPTAIVGLGFSQGGMMTIELMRARPGRFRAGVDLSGVSASRSVPGHETLATDRPPLFWGCDDLDPIISAAASSRAREFLPAHFTLTSRRYPGIGHSISLDELTDVSAFLDETAR